MDPPGRGAIPASAPRAERLARRLDRLYEFDREPVAAGRLHGGWRFAGMYAGEHVAATEFVIGALFVSWGTRTADVLIGLLLGNLLAVLSWALVCAPLATGTRLTLYWYLRRVAGPGVTALFNLLNAVLYCILAGAMITVAASAVRLPFGIPPQTHWYPDDLRFVLVVLAVGAVVVTLAISGFKRLAQFASICSPWMIVMFAAGALLTWPELRASLAGPADPEPGFRAVADARIWTGEPAAGGARLGFWHVAAFAWICNIAMHLGLSDMALLRYARRSAYGLTSACGMFLGHYLAWIAAGVMGAAAAWAAQQPLTGLDSGAVAFHALGVAGAVAVVIAGWTTSNPTLYRAGLALQAVTPDWPRWRVTLVAGALTTLVACSPFVFTKLLGFVGVYGILLAPVGGIVVAEHWLLPRLGVPRYAGARRAWHLPALIAWLAASGGAVVLWQTDTVHLFFLAVPAWLLAGLLYALLQKMAQPAEGASTPQADAKPAAAPGPVAPEPTPPESATPAAPAPRRAPRPATQAARTAATVAALALAAILALALRVFLGFGEREAVRPLLLLATAVYFVAGSLWVYRRAAGSTLGGHD